MRPRYIVIGLATTIIALLLPAGAARANYQPWNAVISCDSSTNRITAGVAGGAGGYWTPNLPVFITFTVANGYYHRGNTDGIIPERNTSVTVAAKTGPDGSLTATGYSRPWNSADYAFYTETVNVSVTGQNGERGASGTATCQYDRRTKFEMICDTQGRRMAAVTTGVSFLGSEYPYGLQIEYINRWSVFQSKPTDQRWAQYVITNPWLVHTVSASASGTWSDTAYDYTYTAENEPYYAQQNLTVVVRDIRSQLIVGRASGSCTYQGPG